MQIDATVLAVIAGMALVTYLTRVGGFVLLRRVRLSPRLEAWLRHLPGALLVSIVAPAVLTTGLAEGLGAAATALVMVRTENLLLALSIGTAVVVVLRALHI